MLKEGCRWAFRAVNFKRTKVGVGIPAARPPIITAGIRHTQTSSGDTMNCWRVDDEFAMVEVCRKMEYVYKAAYW